MESNWNNANTMKNINFYTVRTLAKDLGLPKELASEIVQYKRKKGKICSFDELLNIKGMSPCLMDRIKDNTTIPKEKDVCVGKGHKTSVSKRQGQLPTVSKHKKRFRKATPTKQKSHLNEIKTESNFQLEDCEWAVFPVSVYPSPSENEIVIKYRKEVNGSAKVVSLPSPLVLKDNTKKSVCVQTPKAFLQNCDSTERGVPKTPKHIPMQHSAVVDTGEQTEEATSAKFSTQPVHGSNLTSSNINIREQQFGAFLTPDNVKQHDDNYGFKHPPDKEKRASIRNWLKQISQTELMEIPKTKSVCEMKVDEIQAINQHQNADQTTEQQKEADEHKPDETISPAGVAKMKNTSLELMSEEQEHRPEVEKNRTEAGGKMEGIQQDTQTEKPKADDFVQNKVKDTKNIDKKQNNDNKQQLEAKDYDSQQPGTSSMKDKVPSQTNVVIQTKERSKDEKNLQDSRGNKDDKQKHREKERRHHKHENIKKDELRTHRSHRRHHRHTKGSNAPDHKEHHHKKGHRRERHQTEDMEKLKKEETSKETMAGTCAVS